MTSVMPIFIVDDEMESLDGFELVLASNGFNHIQTCKDSRQAMDEIARNEPSVILLDLSMPHISGRELLEQINVKYPHIPVIIVTGMNEIETAVACMSAGAHDYMVKPVEPQRLVASVRRAVELQEERIEYKEFREKILADDLANPRAFSHIITSSKTMRSIFQYCETIAGTGKPVLITGESGVGKEMIARVIHNLSQLKGNFVPVNVAGLDDQLFSDTLFGHLRGAFTTAENQRPGLINKARGGTLFLDEIGDLSLASQIKLLRILQENEYYPMGSDIPLEMDTRVMVATNRNLIRLMEQKAFRTDLYYRIQTHHIYIPPLRKRTGDIPLLLDHFLDKAARNLGQKKPTAPAELPELLSVYRFPGNVREMESMVFDAVSNHKKGVLSTGRFRDHIRKHQAIYNTPLPATGALQAPPNPFSLMASLPTLKEAPVFLIKEALARTKGNRGAAAMILGITRSGLNKALRRAGIQSE
jgi:DNA-binding NtrC family response regulator